MWLLYCVSGALAFAAVYRGRWRIGWAVVAGGLITTIGWILMFVVTDGEKRPDWVQLDLSLNITFGLIFAVFGAALGWWRLKLRGRAD